MRLKNNRRKFKRELKGIKIFDTIRDYIFEFLKIDAVRYERVYVGAWISWISFSVFKIFLLIRGKGIGFLSALFIVCFCALLVGLGKKYGSRIKTNRDKIPGMTVSIFLKEDELDILSNVINIKDLFEIEKYIKRMISELPQENKP